MDKEEFVFFLRQSTFFSLTLILICQGVNANHYIVENGVKVEINSFGFSGGLIKSSEVDLWFEK